MFAPSRPKSGFATTVAPGSNARLSMKAGKRWGLLGYISQSTARIALLAATIFQADDRELSLHRCPESS